MKMFMQHLKSCRKIKGSKDITLHQNMVRSAFGGGGGSLHLPCVWLANYIWDSMYFNGNSFHVVRADNFCPINRTIWQCFESEFAVRKSFPFAFAFQSTVFSLNRQPCFFFLWFPFLFFCHPLDQDYRWHWQPYIIQWAFLFFKNTEH